MILVFSYLVKPEARPSNFEEQLLGLSLPETPIIETKTNTNAETAATATSSTTNEAATSVTNPAPITSSTSGTDSPSVPESSMAAKCASNAQSVNACGAKIINDTSAKSAAIDVSKNPVDHSVSTSTPQGAKTGKKKKLRALKAQKKLSLREAVKASVDNVPADVAANVPAPTADAVATNSEKSGDISSKKNPISARESPVVAAEAPLKPVLPQQVSVVVDAHKQMAANSVSGCSSKTNVTSEAGNSSAADKRKEHKRRQRAKAAEAKRLERETAYQAAKAEACKMRGANNVSKSTWTVVTKPKRGDKKPKSHKRKMVDVSQMYRPTEDESEKPQVEVSQTEASKEDMDLKTAMEVSQTETSREDLDLKAALKASEIEVEKVKAANIQAKKIEAGNTKAAMKASMVEAEKKASEFWTLVGPKRGKSKSHTKTKPLKVGDSKMNHPKKDESEEPQVDTKVEDSQMEASKEEMEFNAAIKASQELADRLEAEKAEKAEADRNEAAATKASKIEADRLEAEKIEAEKIEAEKTDAAETEADRFDAIIKAAVEAKVAAAMEAFKNQAAEVSQEASEKVPKKVTFSPVVAQYEIPNREDMLEASQVESPLVEATQNDTENKAKRLKTPEQAERVKEKRRAYRIRKSNKKQLAREAQALEAPCDAEVCEEQADDSNNAEVSNNDVATEAAEAAEDTVEADTEAAYVDPFGSTKTPAQADKRRTKRARQRAFISECKRLYSASEVYLDFLQNDVETEVEMEADVETDIENDVENDVEIDVEMEADVETGIVMEPFMIEASNLNAEIEAIVKEVEDVASTNEVAIEALEKAVLDQKKDLVFLEFEAEDDALEFENFELEQAKKDAAFKAEIEELEKDFGLWMEKKVDSVEGDVQPVAAVQEIIEKKQVVEVDERTEEDKDTKVRDDIDARWVALGIPPRFTDWLALPVDSDTPDLREESEPETTSPKVPSTSLAATDSPLKPEITITPTDSITPNDPLTPEDLEGNPIEIVVETDSDVSEFHQTEMVKCEVNEDAKAIEQAAGTGEPNALEIADEDASTEFLSEKEDLWEGSWLQAKVTARTETILEEDKAEDEVEAEDEVKAEVHAEVQAEVQAEVEVEAEAEVKAEGDEVKVEADVKVEEVNAEEEVEIEIKDDQIVYGSIFRQSEESLDCDFGSYCFFDGLPADQLQYDADGADNNGNLLTGSSLINSTQPLLGESQKKHLRQRMSLRFKRIARKCKSASHKIGSKVEDALAKVAEARHQRPTQVGTGLFHWDGDHVEACISIGEYESCSSPRPRRHRLRKFFGFYQS